MAVDATMPTIPTSAPASATRPDAVTAALVEATWPLLIPIDTEAPLVQAAFDEAICTFQSPSNVAAVADVTLASATIMEAAITKLRNSLMTCPFWFGHDQALTTVGIRL